MGGNLSSRSGHLLLRPTLLSPAKAPPSHPHASVPSVHVATGDLWVCALAYEYVLFGGNPYPPHTCMFMCVCVGVAYVHVRSCRSHMTYLHAHVSMCMCPAHSCSG